jgi:hypothetical protein
MISKPKAADRLSIISLEERKYEVEHIGACQGGVLTADGKRPCVETGNIRIGRRKGCRESVRTGEATKQLNNCKAHGVLLYSRECNTPSVGAFKAD